MDYINKKTHIRWINPTLLLCLPGANICNKPDREELLHKRALCSSRLGYLCGKPIFRPYADPGGFLPTSSSREISRASAMFRSVWIDGLGVTPFSTFK